MAFAYRGNPDADCRGIPYDHGSGVAVSGIGGYIVVMNIGRLTSALLLAAFVSGCCIFGGGRYMDIEELFVEGDLLEGPSWDWRVFESTKYLKAGAVKFEDGIMTIAAGEPFSGAALTDPVYSDYYELSLEARRTAGSDIFCGIYFPVGDSHCSVVLGGWGNSLSGLSMLDGLSAAENETAYPQSFGNDKWVKVQLKVLPESLTLMADGETVIHLDREGRELTPYLGLEMFHPLGFFTYESAAEIRNARITRLPPQP